MKADSAQVSLARKRQVRARRGLALCVLAMLGMAGVVLGCEVVFQVVEASDDFSWVDRIHEARFIAEIVLAMLMVAGLAELAGGLDPHTRPWMVKGALASFMAVVVARLLWLNLVLRKTGATGRSDTNGMHAAELVETAGVAAGMGLLLLAVRRVAADLGADQAGRPARTALRLFGGMLLVKLLTASRFVAQYEYWLMEAFLLLLLSFACLAVLRLRRALVMAPRADMSAFE